MPYINGERYRKPNGFIQQLRSVINIIQSRGRTEQVAVTGHAERALVMRLGGGRKKTKKKVKKKSREEMKERKIASLALKGPRKKKKKNCR